MALILLSAQCEPTPQTKKCLPSLAGACHVNGPDVPVASEYKHLELYLFNDMGGKYDYVGMWYVVCEAM